MQPFHKFAKAVNERLAQLSKQELFVTVSGDEVWDKYLASFPEGSNPIYRERTEHDCSCCRHFIRNLGNVVAIVNGKPTSIWKAAHLAYPYDQVAAALDEFVTSAAITSLFRTSEGGFGAEHTFELLEDGKTKQWDHFYGSVASIHRTNTPDKARGDYATTVQVFTRGLMDLEASAFETVIDLIDQKALYRGEEHLAALKGFQKLQRDCIALKEHENRNLFFWQNATSPFARFRNTAIGTLIQDLSAGVDLEAAVKSFESKVAPTNYKRPTALITPRMVQDATKTINELGLESALERRFAKISDVSVNNVLWVDNSARALMKDGIEGLLMDAAVSKPKGKVEAEDIGIDEFMANILPGVTGMETLVRNSQLGNFMSLTAPVHEDSGSLFKWGNDFGWSYDGDITDSIKERVKRAGGNVTSAKLRVSLAWFNYDDLDIHIYEPTGFHIFFAHKSSRYGRLDVDMNAGGRHQSREPVENVSWTSVQDGTYRVVINQYSKQENRDFGFELEVESEGRVEQFSYKKAVTGNVNALILQVEGGRVVDIKLGDGVTGGTRTQEKWGINTETFTKVTTLMKSPNHWDDNEVGNKHWFFVLDGCRNPEATRGIYNEFLHSSLDKHRKVFEILGDKTKCQPTDDQLSGVGFSSTRGDTVQVRVTGPKLRKIYNIKF